MKSTDAIQSDIERSTIKLMRKVVKAFEKDSNLLKIAKANEDEFQRIWGEQDKIRFGFFPPFNNDALDLALASSRGFLLGFMDWAEDAEMEGEDLEAAKETTADFLVAMAYWNPRLAMAIDALANNYAQMKKERGAKRGETWFLDRMYYFVVMAKKIRVKRNLFEE